MIQNYLNGGGSFFMASMEILSRLGNVAFRKNVLQAGGFKQNPDPLSSCADCDEDAACRPAGAREIHHGRRRCSARLQSVPQL